MKYKKGDIVETIHKDLGKKNMYLIISIDYKHEQYVAVRIFDIDDDSKKSQWNFFIDNNGDKLLVKYDYFSRFKEEQIKYSDYELFISPFLIIDRVYEMNDKNINKITRQRREKQKNAQKKNNKKRMEREFLIKGCQKNSVKTSLSHMKGVHDATYKGKITIVRG